MIWLKTLIFHHGVDSIFVDASMHHIEIIDIENKISIYRIEKQILNNDIPKLKGLRNRSSLTLHELTVSLS